MKNLNLCIQKLALIILVFGLSGLAANLHAQTLTSDFYLPGSALIVLGGDVVSDVETSVDPLDYFLHSPASMSVTFDVMQNNSVIYSETVPSQLITDLPDPLLPNRHYGIGNLTLPFTLPNDPNITNAPHRVYVTAHYSYSANTSNTIVSQDGGVTVGSTNTSTGSATHTIGSFWIDYTYDDPCSSTLSATVGKKVDKWNNMNGSVYPIGGSGNYSYSWQVVSPTNSNNYSISGSTITVRCGCVYADITITDNVTGCTHVISESFCSPKACLVRPRKTKREANVQGEDLLQVYPNPADDFVTIKIDKNLSSPVVQIMDMTGRVVEQQRMSSHEARVQVSDVMPGIYLVRLMDGASLIKQEKIVIQ